MWFWIRAELYIKRLVESLDVNFQKPRIFKQFWLVRKLRLRFYSFPVWFLGLPTLLRLIQQMLNNRVQSSETNFFVNWQQLGFSGSLLVLATVRITLKCLPTRFLDSLRLLFTLFARFRASELLFL